MINKTELVSKIVNAMLDMLVPGLFTVSVDVTEHAAAVLLRSTTSSDQWVQELLPLSDFGDTEEGFRSQCRWAVEALVTNYALEYFITETKHTAHPQQQL